MEMTYSYGALVALRDFDKKHTDWTDDQKQRFDMIVRTITRLEVAHDEVSIEHIELAIEIASGKALYFCPDCRVLVSTHNPGAFYCPECGHGPLLRITFPEE